METLKLARTRNEQKQILKLIHIQKHRDTHTYTQIQILKTYTNPYIYYRYRISDVTMERRTDRLLYIELKGRTDATDGRKFFDVSV